MQMTKRIFAAVLGLALSFSLIGCSAQDGLKDGVQDGLASALAALITAPVEAWIGATFPG